jgi:hypothetical protein
MKKLAICLCSFVLLACEDTETNADEPMESGGGKADDSDDAPVDTRGYNFELDDSAFSVVRDHVGAPLLATFWGRIAEYNREAPFIERHAWNETNDGLPVPWLAHITAGFHRVHQSWAPSFEEMGLDTCDPLGVNDDWFDSIGNGELDFDVLQPEQCFGQRMLWPNPDQNFELESYRRTIAVSLPDYLTIELDAPAAFPNGRVLHEQINSLMFAMAFLDQGGDCGEEECNLHTLWRRDDFLKPDNDVPFFGASAIGEPARSFPFLATPHRRGD